MDGLIEFLYLIGIAVIAFIAYTIYCLIDRSRFEHKWVNLEKYCFAKGYRYIARRRSQTDYRREMSREEVQSLLNLYEIDCKLPPDLRYFDNISVTYVKPYERHNGFTCEYHGDTRFHRYFTIQWLENGQWMQYTGDGRRPYVDADFGGMISDANILPDSSFEMLERSFEYELRYILPKFKETQIDRRINENGKARHLR